MDDHRRKILDMLSEGKISAEEAARLLEKLGVEPSEDRAEKVRAERNREGSGKGSILEGLGMNPGKLGEKVKRAAKAAQEAAAEVDREGQGDSASGQAAQGRVSSKRVSANGSTAYAAGQAYAEGGTPGVAIPGKPGVVHGQSSSISYSVSSSDMPSEIRSSTALHVSGKPLRVRTVNGGVRVQRGQGEVVAIEATLRAETEERLRDAEILTERISDGMLSLGVKWPGGEAKPGEGCSFSINIPDARGLDIETQNGRVDISGMGGAARLSSTNASISANGHQGSLEATTSNGNITLEEVSESATARSNNGKIKMAGIGGAVIANTSNKSVSVELADGNAGPVQIKTDNGKVRLELSEAFKGELKLATSNAKVKFNLADHINVVASEKDSAVLQAGDGPNSRVDTRNAAIKVQFK